ncbi:Zinc knuckle [Carex littledalei]|uniref:Zinc knuckle n=1 Tax=Carex littledalei TaxID=544730 RepID=A0A833V4X7_9POAL|nr:Zinc knuckle [Carex littledalei]
MASRWGETRALPPVQLLRRRHEGESKTDTRETWLTARTKLRQAIHRRNTQIAEFRRLSYKEALQQAIVDQEKVTPQTVQPPHKETSPPINGGPNTRNDKGKGALDATTPRGIDRLENEGWTEVRRKKKSTEPRSTRQDFSQWRQTLLAQGKCFKCLLKGHRKFECTREIKCHRCNKSGHVSAICKSPVRINGEVKRAPTISSNTQPLKINTHIQRPIQQSPLVAPERPQRETSNNTKEKPNTGAMDYLANWETMPLIDPQYVGNHRPTYRRVFLTKRDTLAPANEFLERSAIVLTGPNHNTPTLAYSIVRKMATLFSLNPKHFEIRRIPPAMGDYLAIFPSVNIRNEACNICAFDLGSGVQIQMARWVKKRLWCMTRLRTRYGFEYTTFHWKLRVLVAYHHPTHVFEDITITDENFSATVHLEMEGWLIAAAIPTPQNSADQGGHRRQDDREDEAEYWDRVWQEGIRERQRQRQRQNLSDSGGSSGPVTRFNKEHDNIRITATPDPQMEATMMETTGEGVSTGGTLVSKKTKLVHYGQREQKGVQTVTEVEVLLQSNPFNTAISIHAKDIHGKLCKEIWVKLKPTLMDWVRGIGFTLFKATGFQTEGETEGLQIEEVLAGPVSPHSEAEFEFHTATFQIEGGLQEIDSPHSQVPSRPAAFEQSPQDPLQVRRSTRLSTKNSGSYVDPIERAQRVSKPDSAPSTAGKPRKKHKTPLFQQEYLNSYELLTGNHAEAILMEAGVEYEGKIADQVETVIAM